MTLQEQFREQVKKAQLVSPHIGTCYIMSNKKQILLHNEQLHKEGKFPYSLEELREKGYWVCLIVENGNVCEI